jgi:WD40 repeat protein
MKGEIGLYEGAEAKGKFDFVHTPFHTKEITGLDVCIRKQLVVTCSTDKSIKIWNYNTKKLEISQIISDKAYAVAFHPSGFHLVVAVPDKIILVNVLSKSLSLSKTI